MRSLKWVLIRSDWCPYEKSLGHLENMPGLCAHEGQACEDKAGGAICHQRERSLIHHLALWPSEDTDLDLILPTFRTGRKLAFGIQTTQMLVFGYGRPTQLIHCPSPPLQPTTDFCSSTKERSKEINS